MYELILFTRFCFCFFFAVSGANAAICKPCLILNVSCVGARRAVGLCESRSLHVVACFFFWCAVCYDVSKLSLFVLHIHGLQFQTSIGNNAALGLETCGYSVDFCLFLQKNEEKSKKRKKSNFFRKQIVENLENFISLQ